MEQEIEDYEYTLELKRYTVGKQNNINIKHMEKKIWE